MIAVYIVFNQIRTRHLQTTWYQGTTNALDEYRRNNKYGCQVNGPKTFLGSNIFPKTF